MTKVTDFFFLFLNKSSTVSLLYVARSRGAVPTINQDLAISVCFNLLCICRFVLDLLGLQLELSLTNSHSFNKFLSIIYLMPCTTLIYHLGSCHLMSREGFIQTVTSPASILFFYLSITIKITIANTIWYLICARHCSKWFIYVKLFDPHENLWRRLHFTSIFRGEKTEVQFRC